MRMLLPCKRPAAHLAALAFATCLVFDGRPAQALSEIGEDARQPDFSVPMPDPVQTPSRPAPVVEDPEAEAEEIPTILYDEALLPEPVRAMRTRIMEAAASGDIQALRPLIGSGSAATQLSLGEPDADPLQHLAELSGDTQGQEILAILYEVLDTGFVMLDAGTPDEIYVWPYFYAVPLEDLDPRQRVELFKLVTAGDYEDMKIYGSYIFYRAGITADGQWRFFVAGD
jgi:hypothetical protein